jgi:hypothetical protein
MPASLIFYVSPGISMAGTANDKTVLKQVSGVCGSRISLCKINL